MQVEIPYENAKAMALESTAATISDLPRQHQEELFDQELEESTHSEVTMSPDKRPRKLSASFLKLELGLAPQRYLGFQGPGKQKYIAFNPEDFSKAFC